MKWNKKKISAFCLTQLYSLLPLFSFSTSQEIFQDIPYASVPDRKVKFDWTGKWGGRRNLAGLGEWHTSIWTRYRTVMQLQEKAGWQTGTGVNLHPTELWTISSPFTKGAHGSSFTPQWCSQHATGTGTNWTASYYLCLTSSTFSADQPCVQQEENLELLKTQLWIKHLNCSAKSFPNNTWQGRKG